MPFSIIVAEHILKDRDLITNTIKKTQLFDVIDFCDHGSQLLNAVLQKAPDILIINLNLPGLQEFLSIDQALKFFSSVKVIFLTSNNEISLNTQDFFSILFIKKPLHEHEIFLAVENKLRSILHKDSCNLDGKCSKRLCIKNNHNLYYIPVNQIMFIEKLSNKVLIHTETEIIESNYSLEQIGNGLEYYFYRSHRSYIINLKKIAKITPSGKTYLVYFYNYSKPGYISKNQISIVKKLMDYLVINPRI